jgi:hypothetical protein
MPKTGRQSEEAVGQQRAWKEFVVLHRQLQLAQRLALMATSQVVAWLTYFSLPKSSMAGGWRLL